MEPFPLTFLAKWHLFLKLSTYLHSEMEKNDIRLGVYKFFFKFNSLLTSKTCLIWLYKHHGSIGSWMHNEISMVIVPSLKYIDYNKRLVFYMCRVLPKLMPLCVAPLLDPYWREMTPWPALSCSSEKFLTFFSASFGPIVGLPKFPACKLI